MDDRSKKLAFAICQHLKDNLATVSKDSVEGIEVAIQCIGEAFGVDPDADSKYSIKPANLASIFEVFMANQQRMGDQEDAAAANAKAEGLKADGNKKMAARDYAGAIALYSQAIDLAPNAVFYSNRAAAYSQKGDHASAAVDAKKAVKIDPAYSKAYSRLGHAHFGLGDFKAAVDAYESGLKLDPENQPLKQSLVAAQQKAGAVTSARAAPAAAGAAAPGGMDFASMFSNPEFMNMASSMMKNNPALSQMMENPAIKNMMKDPAALSQMMSNPAVKNMMKNPEALGSLLNNPEMASMAEEVMKNPDALNAILSNPELGKPGPK